MSSNPKRGKRTPFLCNYPLAASTPLTGDFSVYYRQMCNPAFELDAGIIGTFQGNALEVTLQPYMPDEDWEALSIGRFELGTPIRKVISALAAKREVCCGPSFPSLERAVVDWSSDTHLECAGIDKVLGEWMLLALADFDGESIAEAASNASESRIRALHFEHLTLLCAEALRYFAKVKETIDRRRLAKQANTP